MFCLFYCQQNQRISAYRKQDSRRQLVEEGSLISSKAMEQVKKNLTYAQSLKVDYKQPTTSVSSSHSSSSSRTTNLQMEFFVYRQRGAKRSASGKDNEIGLEETKYLVYLNLECKVVNCTCLAHKMDMLPCSHIIAVLIDRKRQGILFHADYVFYALS